MKVEKKSVEMRMNVTTIENIKKIMEITGQKNRTAIVSQAVGVFYEFISIVKEKGGEVFIEYPDDTRRKIIF